MYSQRFGSLQVPELIVNNVLRLEPTFTVLIYVVFYIEYTFRVRTPPTNKTLRSSAPGISVSNEVGDVVIELFHKLGHLKRGFGLQFPTLYKNPPNQEAEWKPNWDFVYSDGTITGALYKYICEDSLLLKLKLSYIH